MTRYHRIINILTGHEVTKPFTVEEEAAADMAAAVPAPVERDVAAEVDALKAALVEKKIITATEIDAKRAEIDDQAALA